jgi:succinate-acetate transporter protein
MQFELSRLRSGEWIAGIGALLLLIVMFALPWYGLKGSAAHTARAVGVSTSINGYNEFTHLSWLILLTIVVVFALVFLQATRSAPALPASFSVIALVLSVLMTLWLIYRVLINVPSGDGLLEQTYGAYAGLLCALAMTYGAYRSLREEERPDPERNARIPVVELGSEPAAPPSAVNRDA